MTTTETKTARPDTEPARTIWEIADYIEQEMKGADDEAREWAQQILDANEPAIDLQWKIEWMQRSRNPAGVWGLLGALLELLQGDDDFAWKERAVRMTLKKMHKKLLHGPGTTSTNPYDNAVRADKLRACAYYYEALEWRHASLVDVMQEEGVALIRSEDEERDAVAAKRSKELKKTAAQIADGKKGGAA